MEGARDLRGEIERRVHRDLRTRGARQAIPALQSQPLQAQQVVKLPAESRAIYCARPLLPYGWAKDGRLRIAGGTFAGVERGALAQPADERVAVALPGMPNVHSHGFQRGMAGLTEYRGPEADNFWSWRELMYRFVAG